MTRPDIEADHIDPEMEKLLDEAQRTGKLLHEPFHDITFTAAELRKAQREGRFRWGAKNWRLIAGNNKLQGIDSQIARLQREREETEKQMARAREG